MDITGTFQHIQINESKWRHSIRIQDTHLGLISHDFYFGFGAKEKENRRKFSGRINDFQPVLYYGNIREPFLLLGLIKAYFPTLEGGEV